MNIVIIDDNEIDIKHAERTLGKAGHFVISFFSASTALLWLSSGESFDFIILDINMPNKSGWDFCESYLKLKLDPSKIIVMLPSISMAEYGMNKGSNYGVQHFAAKPIEVEAFDKIARR